MYIYLVGAVSLLVLTFCVPEWNDKSCQCTYLYISHAGLVHIRSVPLHGLVEDIHHRSVELHGLVKDMHPKTSQLHGS